MKYLILLSFLSMISCSRKWNGVYQDPQNSEHYLQSCILAIDGETFELTTSRTHLTHLLGNKGIHTMIGKIDYHKNKIRLYPEEEKNAMVVFDKAIRSTHEPIQSDSIATNNDQPVLKGSRAYAFIPIDTMHGPFKKIVNSEPVDLVIIEYPNSVYLVNEEFCLYTYHDINLEHKKDMTNYCELLQSQVNQ